VVGDPAADGVVGDPAADGVVGAERRTAQHRLLTPAGYASILTTIRF
jgi:hypothetical protein